jgi:hypothetical protein
MDTAVVISKRLHDTIFLHWNSSGGRRRCSAIYPRRWTFMMMMMMSTQDNGKLLGKMSMD